jgi:hypothetical protein
MKNYGPKANFQLKRSGAGGQGIRVALVCAVILVGGITASQAAGAQGPLEFSPTSASFGSIDAGTSKMLSMTILNAGRAAVTISNVAVSGPFGVSGLSVPATINPGASLSVTLKFAPPTTGAFSGYLAIRCSRKSFNVTNYTMTGTGVATGSASTLTATPSSTSFGSVPIGTTNSQTVQLKNTGTASVTISNISVTGTGFTQSGITTPLALAGGKTTNATLIYAPTVSGYAAGTVTIASNATNKSLT